MARFRAPTNKDSRVPTQDATPDAADAATNLSVDKIPGAVSGHFVLHFQQSQYSLYDQVDGDDVVQ